MPHDRSDEGGEAYGRSSLRRGTKDGYRTRFNDFKWLLMVILRFLSLVVVIRLLISR